MFIMCTQPRNVYRKNKVTGQVALYTVPCGECAECLRHKQAENAVLAYLEALKTNKLVFVTFTYNNDSFPIRQRVGVIYEDGVVEYDRPTFVSDDRLPKLRKLYCETAGEDFSQVMRSTAFTDKSGKEVFYEYAPSLDRSEWRAFIKRARSAWERNHGETLDFSYFCVGEYGELHYRPHFHCLFHNLTENQVRELCSEWPKKYGYIDIKEVSRFDINRPLHDGFLASAQYIGKYVTKGPDDSYNVQCGLAEKSRVLRSLRYGIDKKKMMSFLSFVLWKLLLIS